MDEIIRAMAAELERFTDKEILIEANETLEGREQARKRHAHILTFFKNEYGLSQERAMQYFIQALRERRQEKPPR